MPLIAILSISQAKQNFSAKARQLTPMMKM